MDRERPSVAGALVVFAIVVYFAGLTAVAVWGFTQLF
jgi:hypothetical protein